MNKVWLIIQWVFEPSAEEIFFAHHYLVPLIIPAIMAGLVYLAIKQYESAKADVVQVVDESGKFNFEN